MTGRRLDIQGLRALAVGLVILHHLVGWPTGGFIGVDVFFVISGFLITGLLFREQSRTGKISLRAFYARRIKRILPAALFVLVATIAVALVLFPRPRAMGILLDGLWASVFGANWRFIATGTDYLHATDALSPLQHYWSLSVEEQFYIVIPVLLVAVFAVAKADSMRIATALIAGITFASFGFAVWESLTNPTSAYFSTTSRAWELGAGSLLAIGLPLVATVPERLRAFMAWSGFALLVTAAFVITESHVFPGPWALLPVVGTLMVIAGGSGDTGRLGVYPLRNPVAGYFGTISYSLYLWHLPVIVFLSALLPTRGGLYVALATLLILALSILSYHWVEDPLRRATWGSGWKWPARTSLPRAGALSALVCVVLASGFIAAENRTSSTAQAAIIDELLPEYSAGPDEAERYLAVDTALQAVDWPTLQPAIDDLGEKSRVEEWVSDGCLARESNNKLSPENNALRCVYGNETAPRTLALVGDSIAISYLPAVRDAIGDSWRIEVYTMSQCPAVDVAMAFDGDPGSICDNFREWTATHLAETAPDLVVLSSGPGSVGKLASGNTGVAAEEEWAEGAERTFARYSDQLVISLDAPPGMKKFEECAISGSTPLDCVSPVTEQFAALGAAVRKAASSHPNVTVPSTIGWFCSEDGLCPSFIDNTPTIVDGNHLSDAASHALAPLMLNIIEDATTR